MHYLQNHIWCSESNWDNMPYDCQHLVSLNNYQDGYVEDWNSIVDEEADEYFDERGYEIALPIMKGKIQKDWFYSKAPNLKPNVLKWLHENVIDRKGQECNKGWCIGSVAYRGNDSNKLTIFFHRKSDAMAFIKTFSKWEKPILYQRYFSDVTKKLDLDTGKYPQKEKSSE